ncbi:FAD-dependent oxidoreductase [Streptomyces virginiae]|uniref:FAD-dependent oxidoreductase n=1 Tax=Streptomyces virginiae TaxID=1961 RepID=UPI00225093E3|nr:FAD-dependent oxidoreductase [Streptomyces virginiae]MCX4721174.1 NAD(P)/FAD-dependent oxidoreductase [Streptomyces virginiae]MCX5275686.1 NAD(P)/FAD-dependent oxidoreductase [Streptomyces virginiae]
MSESGSRTGRWRLVVVGGGSAGVIQVRQGDVPPQEILVVAERVGTGMAFLGRTILQSYADELILSRQSGELQSALAVGELRPNADEYDTYVRESLLRSGASVTLAKVMDIQRDEDGFVLSLRTPGGVRRQVYADAVVLATGSTPRRPPEDWQAAGAISYDTVYRELTQGNTSRWAGLSVVIAGAGNSAMQTAGLMAPAARDVTILANRYVGMYPSESDDRFAWRAPSQLTYELVAKSSRECGRRPWRVPCVRHLVHDSLDMDGETVRWRYRREANLGMLGSHSLPDRCRHARGTVVSGGEGDEVWEETRGHDSVVVWATGSNPVYPPGELLASLSREPDGSLSRDEYGRTGVPGLFVTGACAGQRSVNDTVPARTRTPLVAVPPKAAPEFPVVQVAV